MTRSRTSTKTETDHDPNPGFNWCLLGALVGLGAFWWFIGVPAIAAFVRLAR